MAEAARMPGSVEIRARRFSYLRAMDVKPKAPLFVGVTAMHDALVMLAGEADR